MQGHAPSAGGASRAIDAGVFAAFFVSGACGLVHQVVWSRLLRHVMGNDTYAVTTALCAFMGGLAVGSFLGGYVADRRRDLLRVFAVLEGTIGLYCLFLPSLIGATEPLYGIIYRNTAASAYGFSLVRFVFCGALLLLPATLMGATLPVLARFLVRSPARVGRSVGVLYTVNTLGAVLGAALAGFVLIGSLGVRATIVVACMFNFAVAAAAFLLYRRAPRLPAAEPDGGQLGGRHAPQMDADAGDSNGYQRRLAAVVLLIGYGLSGFAALVYEVAWTRVLSLLIVCSVYAFSLMLTAFILGLGIGGVAGARFADRLRDPMRGLGLIEVGIGLSALAVVPLFGLMPGLVAAMTVRLGGSFWLLQLAELGLMLVVMLVPTMLMGAAFPLASRLFVRRASRTGRGVGTLYGSNTLGAILGAFAAGFVLIPWLGIQQTILGAVWINVLAGCAFIGLSRASPVMPRILMATVSVLLAAAGMVMTPGWDASRMTVGPEVRSRPLQPGLPVPSDVVRRMEGQEIVFHEEGIGATVTVRKGAGGLLTLLVNGVPEASSVGGRAQQSLLAHIPLLLHSDPRRVLVIGLASGMTLASAAAHPVEVLDCVEISPGVVAATRLFDEYNGRVLDDPRVRVIVADGRTHLALAGERYDVIISQPSHLWTAGVGDLFTREFFQVCYDRLEPGGMLCAWLDASAIGTEAFRSVVHTLRSVFEDVTVWKASREQYLLLGSCRALAVSPGVLARRLERPPVAADLGRIELQGVADLLGYLVMGDAGAQRLSQGASMHTDDNALLEFSAPRALAASVDTAGRMAAIEQFRECDLAFLQEGAEGAEALAALKAQVARTIRSRGHVEQANIRLAQGRMDAVAAELRGATALEPADVWLRWYLQLLDKLASECLEQGRPGQAIELYGVVIEVDPRDDAARYGMGSALTAGGDVISALPHLEEAARLNPGWAAPSNDAAWILATCPDAGVRDGERAVRLAERAAALTGHRSAAVLDTLAAAYAEAGAFEQAVATARSAIALASAAVDPLAEELRLRLALYEARRPYREAGR